MSRLHSAGLPSIVDGLTEAEASAAYVAKAGGDTITASAAAVIPLVVKGAASQTASLLQARDSAGAVLVEVDSIGRAEVRPSGATSLFAGVRDCSLAVQPRTASSQGLVVRGLAGQTGNLAEFLNSAGTVLAAVEAGGRLRFDANTDGNSLGAFQGRLAVSIGGTVRYLAFYA